jgi:hypothetical protein
VLTSAEEEEGGQNTLSTEKQQMVSYTKEVMVVWCDGAPHYDYEYW